MWMLMMWGCGWDLPNHDTLTVDALWDPSSAVATSGAVTVVLPESGGVARIPREGDPTAIDLGEGEVRLLQGVAGSDTLVALIDRTRCSDEEVQAGRPVDACPSQDRQVTTEVVLFEADQVVTRVPLEGRSSRLAFSDDARFAIAYLDLADLVDAPLGVIDLTSVVVLDLTDGTAQVTNVGFSAEGVRFQTDDTGRTTGAVVLSRSAVAQLDLLQAPFEVDTTFNLTLDPDQTVTPTTVDLTPDGRHALIAVQGVADLYALDLIDNTINLLELASVPTDVVVCDGADRTVVVYGSQPVVEIFDHERFEVLQVPLDEPMTNILEGEGFVVLYSTANRQDAYRVDLPSGELTEYRLQKAPTTMQIAPTGEFAVAFTSPGVGESPVDRLPGMEVLDLLGNDTQPFLLEGEGVGLAFSETDGRLDAIVLQEGAEYVYQLDLYSGQPITLPLDLPPVGLGALPDGEIFITHDSALGAISFLDPGSGELTTQTGFATLGWLDPTLLEAQ